MYQPQFRITNHLLTYITSVESAKALIDHSPLVPSWEAKFRDEAMLRSVHFGTHIEGNELTANQAGQVVQLRNTSNPQVIIDQTGIVAKIEIFKK
jgi:hypothetical protein